MQADYNNYPVIITSQLWLTRYSNFRVIITSPNTILFNQYFKESSIIFSVKSEDFSIGFKNHILNSIL